MSSAARPQRRSTLQAFVGDTRVIARRNLLPLLRTPQVVVFASIQPVIFVLLFRYVFGGSIHVPGYGPYADFLIPGIVVQTTLFGGSSLDRPRRRGHVEGDHRPAALAPDEPRGDPHRRHDRTVSRTTFTLILVIVVGLAVGFRFHTPFSHIVAGARRRARSSATRSRGSSRWSGSSCARPRPPSSPRFLPIFPLVFAASTFTSPATMPDWLRVFAEQPADHPGRRLDPRPHAGRRAGRPRREGGIVWSLGILAVSAALTIWRFERA